MISLSYIIKIHWIHPAQDLTPMREKLKGKIPKKFKKKKKSMVVILSCAASLGYDYQNISKNIEVMAPTSIIPENK